MSVTAFGKITDRLGHALFVEHRKLDNAAVPVTMATACPSVSLRSIQPHSIPVDRNHSRAPIGEVVHLERDTDQNTWCVAVINADADDLNATGPWHWSMSIAGQRAHDSLTFDDVTIEAVALVRNPAGIALPPLAFLDGDLRHRHGTSTWPGNLVPSYLRRAITAHRGEHRSAATPLFITGPNPTVERISGVALISGEPLANRRGTTTPPRTHAETVLVHTTHSSGRALITIDNPPRGRSTRRKVKLLWQGNPVAHHVGDVGGAMHFGATRTTSGAEALALIDDGVIDGAAPSRLSDGTWSSLQLVVT